MSSAFAPLAVRSSRLPFGRRVLRSEYFVLLLSAAYLVVLALFVPGFASRGNVESILTTLLPLLLLAVGQTFVLVVGGIDLSIGSTVALTSVVAGLALGTPAGWLGTGLWTVPLGLLLMLLTGIGVGLLNGAAIVVFRMPPFMVTLTAMMFFSGLAIWATQSKGIGGLPPAFITLGSRTGPALAVAAGATVFGHLLLNRTLLGRWIYAVGHNRRAAELSGVPTGAVILLAYALSGGFAALASVLLTAQAETASPVLGQRLLLDVIAATVIGGVSLFGGRGKVLWALFGVLFIKLLDNSLNLLDLSFFVIMMVKGGVILIAALLDSWRNAGGAVRG